MLQILLLGTPQIILDGKPIRQLTSAKSQALLYYLAMSGRPESRITLAGLLWPEKSDTEARTNLRQAVRQLRQFIGDAADGGYLVPTRETVSLHETLPLEVDATIFERMANADMEGQTQVLQFALDRYTGEFLSGFYLDDAYGFEEWMLIARERLRSLAIQGLHALAHHYAEQSEIKQGLTTARRLLEIEPWQEEAHRLMMQFLAWDGQTSGALTQFERCRQLLVEELGVEPGGDTVALYNAIRANQIPRKSIRAGEPKTQPVRVTPPNNLPPQITHFIGRTRELAEVKRLLSLQTVSETKPLVTLHGPGGVGKTRLALQIAYELVDQFQHGVWLVELAAISDPLAVPAVVAASLDVREEGGRSLVLTLSDYLRDKALLLVMDNCEHLLETCAQWVKTLRYTAPQLAVLATSRTPLRLEDEQVLPLPPLSIPNSSPAEPLTAASVLKYEAVQLFANRAAQALPGFTLTDTNAAAVAQICHHLDGIPLAIELAAARANAMPVVAIAQRLDQRFRWLNARASGILPRQQTLRALIDWSHDLLSAQEAALFGRLAVFAGGWTLEATEAICDEGDDALDALTGLVEESLVVFGYDPARRRYRMHETIRQYAREYLRASGEEPVVLAWHAHYYAQGVALAAENAQRLPLQDRLDQLEQEHANLRSALEWAVVQDSALALTLAADLGKELRFWELRGHYEEGRRWLHRILEAAPDSPTEARAKALLAAAALSSAVTDFEYGQRCTEESRSLFSQLGVPQGEVEALLVSAELVIFQGKHARLPALVEEAMTIAGEINYKPGLAKGGWLLGEIANHRGDYDQAILHLVHSVALWRQLDNAHELATSLNSLAVAMMNKGEYAEASEVLKETAAINRVLGYRRGMALALHNLAETAMQLGDYPRAKALNSESLRIRRELGLRRGYAFSLENFALLAERENQYPRAVQLLAAAQALREAIGAPVYAFNEEDHARSLAKSHSMLGKVRYALEWSKGWAMTAEQAIVLALS